MSQISPTLELPLVMPAQAQKHVTVNEALLRLDALVRTVVESRIEAVQPISPGEGEAWILPEGASGDDWSGFDVGDLAVYRDGAWTRYAPRDGWRIHVRDEACEVVWAALYGHWRAAPPTHVLAAGSHGAATEAIVIEQTVSDLSGASVVSPIVIPARSVVFCVSVRTCEAISGASAFDCGIAGETSKFGGSLGVATGAVNLGVIGPTAFYADTPIVLTAVGSDFTGGSVTLAIHAWRPVAPTA